MKTYSTPDFATACFLRAIDKPMAGTRREGGRVFFEFSDNEELREELRNYFNGNALVRPQAMSAAMRELKSLIHHAP